MGLRGTLDSLYEDRIKPMASYVKGRLKERGCHDSVIRAYIDLYNRYPDVFIVKGSGKGPQAEDTTILLVDEPTGFKGWVDCDAPEDPYDESMWQQFGTYLKNGHEFAGGRYGMARELKTRNLPFLDIYSLGEICHIVQLAVQRRKLVVYHKKLLKTFDQVNKSIEGAKGTNGQMKHVSDLRELCLLICRMCIRRRNSGLRLEQLRTKMQDDHGLTINEMAFQCTKLSELVKLEPLRSAFVLQNESGAMRLTLGDTSRFSEELRQIHSEALAAEKAWEKGRSRSRSRSL